MSALRQDISDSLNFADGEAIERLAARLEPGASEQSRAAYRQLVDAAREQNQDIFGNEADYNELVRVDRALLIEQPELSEVERLAAALSIVRLGGFKQTGRDAELVEDIADMKRRRALGARGATE